MGKQTQGATFLVGAMCQPSKQCTLPVTIRHCVWSLKSIAKGDHGGYYTIADIGRAELMKHMGVSAKRIPPWLLPDSCLERANIDPADRSRLRPDIMLVEMTPV